MAKEDVLVSTPGNAGPRPVMYAPDSATMLVYDGDCPFCSRYVAYTRFKSAVGQVALINAREGGPVVDRLVAEGCDLDEGMVLVYGGRVYHGSDCIYMMAVFSGRSDIFNRLNAAIFKRRWLATMLYPVLRGGRNATLALLGRKKLHLDEGRPRP